MSNRRKGRVGPNNSIRVEATSYSSALFPVTLRFDVPFIELSDHPSGFLYWWQLLEAVFMLPDPSEFHAFAAVGEEDTRVLRRYVATCRDLAQSSVLGNKGRTTISFGQGGVTVDQLDPPTREALRGTAVTLRQLFANDERASFMKVRSILGRLIHIEAGEHHDTRREMQRAWLRAHGKLRGGSLLAMADHIGASKMGHSLPEGQADRDHVRPEEVLSMFFYGDHIHWDKGSEALEAFKSNDVMSAMADMWLYETVNQLSHFYLGFAKLIESGIGVSDR